MLALALSNGTETVECVPQVPYCADASIAKHRPERRSPSAAQTASHFHRGHLASSVVRYDGYLTLYSGQTLVTRKYSCSRAFQPSKVQQISWRVRRISLAGDPLTGSDVRLSTRWFPSSQRIPHELPRPSCVAALRLPAQRPNHNHCRLRGGFTIIRHRGHFRRCLAVSLRCQANGTRWVGTGWDGSKGG